MYHFLKKITKTILSERIIRSYQPAFRRLVYLFYKGNDYTCNICEAKLKTFLSLPNNDLLCPRCGSLPRTRRLDQLLEEHSLLRGKVLHFSPPFSLHQKLKQNADIQYISSDYEDEFIADVKYDLTNIPVKENHFDLIIAYHVLEHIEADTLAMQELWRVIKEGGFALIQTPFKEGKIYEDENIKTPTERFKHFGQKDHVRIYSVIGLKERLEAVGFTVKVLAFTENVTNTYGFKQDETVLMVSKAIEN